MLLFLLPAFPDDSEVGEAAAWTHYLFSRWTEKKKSILCEELSCEGRDGREEVIKYELIFDTSSCISKRYVKKSKCSEFPSLNVKGVISLSVCEESRSETIL